MDVSQTDPLRQVHSGPWIESDQQHVSEQCNELGQHIYNSAGEDPNAKHNPYSFVGSNLPNSLDQHPMQSDVPSSSGTPSGTGTSENSSIVSRTGSFASSPASRPSNMFPAASTYLGQAQKFLKKKAKLTNIDRKRMCIYNQVNPMVKQEDIAKIFGVDRTTVSKVLRQRDKYLNVEDPGKSNLLLREKLTKLPEIERTTAVWASNMVSRGERVTDRMVRDKYQEFGKALAIPEEELCVTAEWTTRFRDTYPGVITAFDPMMAQQPSMQWVQRPEPDSGGGDRHQNDMMAMSQDTQNNSFLQGMAGGHVDYSQNPLNEHDPSKSGDLHRAFSSISSSSLESHAGSESSKALSRLGRQSSQSSFRHPILQNSNRPPNNVPNHVRSQSHHINISNVNTMTAPSPQSSAPVTPTFNQVHTSSSGEIRYPSPPQTSRAFQPSVDDAARALEVVMVFLRQQPVGTVEVEDYLTSKPF